MWNKVKEFEETIAEFGGSKYAVATDSCTNAIFIAALWNKKIKPFETYNNIAELPKQTYISIPQSLYHAGYKLKFIDLKPNPFEKNFLYSLKFFKSKLISEPLNFVSI